MQELDQARTIRNITAGSGVLLVVLPFVSGNLFVIYLIVWPWLMFMAQSHAVAVWRRVHLDHPHYFLYESFMAVPRSLEPLAPATKKKKSKN